MNQQKSKQVIIERTVTKHETMEVVSSSSSSSVQVTSEKLQKNAKSSSEKHESFTEISSNKKVTNTTSKSEHQQHFVSKTRSEIHSDSTIEEQIDDFVKSTTEEEAKTLLEQISQISASHSAFIFHFVN